MLKHALTIILTIAGVSFSCPLLAVDKTHDSLPKCSSPINVNSGTDCVTTPEFYRLHVYEIGLCNGIDAITKTTPRKVVDWKKNCVKTFDAGSSPVSVLVKNNVSEAIAGGTVIKPPNGTYTHGYVLISGVIEIKGSVSLTDGGSNSFRGQIPGGSSAGSGSICWSSGNGIYAWGFAPKTNCGNSIDSSTYEESIIRFQNIRGAGDCVGSDVNPSFHCNFYSSGDIAEGLDPTTAFLIDSNDNLSTIDSYGNGAGQVDKMLGVATYTTPIVVSNSTSLLDVQFKVTRGLHVNYSFPNSIDIGLLEWKTTIRAQ